MLAARTRALGVLTLLCALGVSAPALGTRRDLAGRLQGFALKTGAFSAEAHGAVLVLRDRVGLLSADWRPRVDDVLIEALRALRTHPDDPDPHFLVLLSLGHDGAPGPFYLPVANDITGIGYQHSDHQPERFSEDPDHALEGVVFMGDVSALSADPVLARYTFLHELSHRWGAYVHVQGPEHDAPRALLGRDCAHWSFFAHTDGSSLEGNRWVPDGVERYRTDLAGAFGFSDLDRYLMGLAPAEAVRPSYYVEGAGGWDCREATHGAAPNPGWWPPAALGTEPAEATGTAVPVRIDDVLAAEGPRVPSYQDAPHRWRVVFALLVPADAEVSAARDAVDVWRRAWPEAWIAAATQPGYPSPALSTVLGDSPSWDAGATAPQDATPADAGLADEGVDAARAPSSAGGGCSAQPSARFSTQPSAHAQLWGGLWLLVFAFCRRFSFDNRNAAS